MGDVVDINSRRKRDPYEHRKSEILRVLIAEARSIEPSLKLGAWPTLDQLEDVFERYGTTVHEVCERRGL